MQLSESRAPARGQQTGAWAGCLWAMGPKRPGPSSVTATRGMVQVGNLLASTSIQRFCDLESPHRLVVRTSRCGRDNPGSTPGVDIACAGSATTTTNNPISARRIRQERSHKMAPDAALTNPAGMDTNEPIIGKPATPTQRASGISAMRAPWVRPCAHRSCSAFAKAGRQRNPDRNCKRATHAHTRAREARTNADNHKRRHSHKHAYKHKRRHAHIFARPFENAHAPHKRKNPRGKSREMTQNTRRAHTQTHTNTDTNTNTHTRAHTHAHT